MRFHQTRCGDSDVYETEDVFGTIRIASERELTPDMLDNITLEILLSRQRAAIS
jgi:hypothetical protein